MLQHRVGPSGACSQASTLLFIIMRGLLPVTPSLSLLSLRRGFCPDRVRVQHKMLNGLWLSDNFFSYKIIQSYRSHPLACICTQFDKFYFHCKNVHPLPCRIETDLVPTCGQDVTAHHGHNWRRFDFTHRGPADAGAAGVTRGRAPVAGPAAVCAGRAELVAAPGPRNGGVTERRARPSPPAGSCVLQDRAQLHASARSGGRPRPAWSAGVWDSRT